MSSPDPAKVQLMEEMNLRFMRLTDPDIIKSRVYQTKMSLIKKAAYANLTCGTEVALLYLPCSGNFTCYATSGRFTEMVSLFADMQLERSLSGPPQLQLSIHELHNLFHNKLEGMSYMTETAVRLKSMGVTEEVVTDLTAAFARALCRHHADEQPAPVQTPAQILLSKIEARQRALLKFCQRALLTTARQRALLNRILFL